MAKILKLGAVLFVITAVTGLVLGGVYTMTLEPINIAKEKKKRRRLPRLSRKPLNLRALRSSRARV